MAGGFGSGDGWEKLAGVMGAAELISVEWAHPFGTEWSAYFILHTSHPFSTESAYFSTAETISPPRADDTTATIAAVSKPYQSPAVGGTV